MSVQILNALGVLSSDVPVGNLLWVDAENGVDQLAKRGRMTIPFRTLVAARNAAVAGDTIVVLPGDHKVSESLATDQVHWHFLNGAIVTAEAALTTAIFRADIAMSFRVTGAGSFYGDVYAHILEIVGAGADIYLEGLQLVTGRSVVAVAASGATVVVRADYMLSEEHCISVSNGTVKIVGRHIESASNRALSITGGATDIDAFRVLAGVDVGLYYSGGTVCVRAFEISAPFDLAVEYGGDGGASTSLTIQGARLVSGATWAFRATAGTGTTFVRLHNCALISAHGTESINAVNSNFPVQFHGTCTANKAKGSNISGPVLSTSPAGFNYLSGAGTIN